MSKKIKCQHCAAEFMPTMDKPSCPGCGVTPAQDADAMMASALAALPEIGSDASLPESIQVFPPGKGVRFTLQDYPGEEFQVDIDATTAEKLDADLQNLLARAAAGHGSEPFADKNHEDAERTFKPLRYFWAGDDKVTGGVRLAPEWIPYGAQLVRAKAFKYFSQNFLFSRARKKVLGLINENVGGLVNRPGFATQAAFARGDATRAPLTNNQEQNMTPEEFKKIVDDALKPVSEKITALEAKAKAAETAVPAKAAADNTAITAAITEALKPVTQQLEQFKTQQQDTLKAAAKAAVAKYVGRVGLAPQDTKAIEFYEKNYLADPAGTQEILGKLPARAGGARVIMGSGDKTVTATDNLDITETEKDVLKAAAKAVETRKLPSTAAGLEAYLHTKEGNDAYAAILAGRSDKRKDLR